MCALMWQLWLQVVLTGAGVECSIVAASACTACCRGDTSACAFTAQPRLFSKTVSMSNCGMNRSIAAHDSLAIVADATSSLFQHGMSLKSMLRTYVLQQ